LGYVFKAPKSEAYLIAAGSAICGATAIAALAPIIKAKPKEISTTIGIVFILNLIAIITFPYFGSILQLSQEQFGFWSALAIHDTSSVLGASSLFGAEAVKVAATLKIVKTLWLVPLVLLSSYFYKSDSDKFGFPLFIIFFALAVLINYLIGFPLVLTELLGNISSTFLLLGLFCIGTQIDKDVMKFLNKGTVLQAIILWVIVVLASLFLVINF